MERLGLFAILTFVATAAIVGLGLLRLSYRSRELPELLLGLSFLLAGFLGTGLSIGSAQIHAVGPVAAFTFGLLALVASHAGHLSLAAFVWVVFRRDTPAGALGFAACAVVLGVGCGVQILLAEPGPREADAGAWISLAGQIAAYSWAFGESLRYGLVIRRRLALGLGDPAVASRMLYWAAAAAAILAIWLHTGWMSLAGATLTPSYGFNAVMGLLASGATWLAFSPIRRARHEAAVGSRGQALREGGA